MVQIDTHTKTWTKKPNINQKVEKLNPKMYFFSRSLMRQVDKLESLSVVSAFLL
jgi:hypothetical protein